MSEAVRARSAPLAVVTSGLRHIRGWWTRSGLVGRIAVSAFGVGLGLALVFAVMFLAITGLRQRSLEARHSQQVIATANELQTLVIDLETGVRGFALTRKRSYLLPWRVARRKYPDAVEKLVLQTKAACARARDQEIDQRLLHPVLSTARRVR
jgi:CHASE3 domain sensor protein